MAQKKIVYLGNRDICYKVIRDNPMYELVNILTFPDCALKKLLDNEHVDYDLVTELDRDYVIRSLIKLSYDILVVNGCPFILPATLLNKQGKILLNTHPTYLPYMRGKRPVNGCLLYGFPLGASTHYISDKIDAGNIIYQEKVDLTPDLDLGLCYYISFSLEERVFRRALEILEKSNFSYQGTKIDTTKYPLFINDSDLRQLDFQKMDAEECARRIRAYGIGEEGCFSDIEGERYVIYDAEQVVNDYLLEKMSSAEIGTLVMKYDSMLMVKCREGLLKIKKYRKL